MQNPNSICYSFIAALLAAIGSSLCCAGPLVLLMIGVSGSWIAGLTAFAPLRPYFIVAVIAAMLWAGWQLHRPIRQCPEGGVCAIPEQRRRYQLVFWAVALVVLLLVISPYWLPLLV